MKTFQIIFQSGRVQNLVAENWKRDTELIRFCMEDGGAVEFPAKDLIMIDEWEDVEMFRVMRPSGREYV